MDINDLGGLYNDLSGFSDLDKIPSLNLVEFHEKMKSEGFILCYRCGEYKKTVCNCRKSEGEFTNVLLHHILHCLITGNKKWK